MPAGIVPHDECAPKADGTCGDLHTKRVQCAARACQRGLQNALGLLQWDVLEVGRRCIEVPERLLERADAQVFGLGGLGGPRGLRTRSEGQQAAGDSGDAKAQGLSAGQFGLDH